MPESAGKPSFSLPTDLFSSEELLYSVLEFSLAAISLYRPIYEPGNGELIDFYIEYVNPTAQRLVGLPERPEGTILQHFPRIQGTDILDFYRRVFLTGEPGNLNLNYPYDSPDNYFHLAAHRCGQILVVSFSDTAHQKRSALEEELRASQAREQVARTEAESLRQRLSEILMHLPANIAFYQGPNHVYELVNPGYQKLNKEPNLPGRLFREAMPELEGQKYFELLDQVYQSGEPFSRDEMEAWIDLTNTGQLERRYFNVHFQPIRNTEGSVNGILSFAYDVTEQKMAGLEAEQSRQQVHKLNEELAQANQNLTAARALADLQLQQLHNILMQAPAMICIFEGPEHVFKFVNPLYQQLVGERPLLGKPIAEAMPELAGQPIFGLLNKVYRTGESFHAHEMLVQLDHDNSGGDLGLNYYNFIYQATRDLAGDITGILVFAYEVTAQVKARQQLEYSHQQIHALNEELEARVAYRTQQLQEAQAETERQRQRLERLFMQAPAAICILDGPEMVFELVNPGYQQLFPGRYLIGKPVLEGLPEIVGQPIADILQNVYTTGKTFVGRELPIALARHENTPVEQLYFSFIFQARFDEQGQVNGILVFAFEVTDLVKARQTTEEAAHQLRLITDALPVLISYLDREGKYRFTNLAYEPWFNKPAKDFLGKTIREVVGEKAYQIIQGYIKQVLTGERVNFEARMPYRENFVRHVRTSYVPDIQGGEVLGFYSMVSDVTDYEEARKALSESEQQAKALARELATANQELEQANQHLTRTNIDLDNFIYAASHDLKAPILNIEGLMEVLLEQGRSCHKRVEANHRPDSGIGAPL